MTRKDYVRIAAALSKAAEALPGSRAHRNGIKSAAYHIANELQEDNGNFKRPVFFEACGLTTSGALKDEEPSA